MEGIIENFEDKTVTVREKISKKELIIKYGQDFKPSVLARKIGCRREYVYMVLKMVDMKYKPTWNTKAEDNGKLRTLRI